MSIMRKEKKEKKTMSICARKRKTPHVDDAQGQDAVVFGKHEVLGLQVPVDDLVYMVYIYYYFYYQYYYWYCYQSYYYHYYNITQIYRPACHAAPQE